MDDVNLIRRACQLEQEAVSQLYREHVQAVYRYIYYRVGDEQLAKDLTADVFVRVVEGLPAYEPRGSPFLAWLYRIARARVADHYRRARQPKTMPLEDDLPAPHEPQQQVEEMQTTQRLLAAIGELTADQQDVIALKFAGALSNAEVAQLLGKTEGSVKSLQHRALNALHRLLSRSDDTR